VILRRARYRAEVHPEGLRGVQLLALLQSLLHAGRGDAEGGLVLRRHHLVAAGRDLKESLSKGRGVRVVGRLKQDRWIGPDGQGRSKVLIVSEHVEFKPNLNGEDGDGKDGE